MDDQSPHSEIDPSTLPFEELIEAPLDNRAYNEELLDFNILDLSNEDLENLTGEITKED